MRRIVLLVVSALIVTACGGSSGGADPERFCELFAAVESQDTTSLDADEALEVIKEGRADFVEIVEVAPADIKADVQTVADVAIKVTDALIDAGGDETAVDLAALSAILADTEGLDAASLRVDEWVTANCS